MTSDENATLRPRVEPFEERLIARFRRGEPEALGTLFDLYVDRVFAFVRHMLSNREDAEEVTSEVFVRAFERATTFRGEGSFRGWLFRIARNLCLDHIRQPRLLWLDTEEADALSDMGRASLEMQTRLIVQEAVQELAPEHRMVLLLCDVEEWDAKEVALMMERSLSATKSLLYRARMALRERLEVVSKEERDGDL